jgi:hypothetical protein
LRRKLKLELARVSQEAQGAPIRGTLVAAHLAAIALFIMFTFVVVRGNPGRSHSNLVAAAWLAAAVAAVVCGAIAVIPCKLWVELARGTGYLWAYTAAAALAAASACERRYRLP